MPIKSVTTGDTIKLDKSSAYYGGQQKRIVEEIDARLSVCDSIEKTVDDTLQQSEAMRQSILKDAFEGRF